jgi:hypothetical protein
VSGKKERKEVGLEIAKFFNEMTCLVQTHEK